jgi:hypothetical protein
MQAFSLPPRQFEERFIRLNANKAGKCCGLRKNASQIVQFVAYTAG